MDNSQLYNNAKESFQLFEIENVTVIRPLLLKEYYWKSLDIKGLNKKLLSDDKRLEHDLNLPSRKLFSRPMKIIFWFRSLSNSHMTLCSKRIQNCQCGPQETRVGINRYRNLYHCPHRRLIKISQKQFKIQSGDLVSMTVELYFHFLGSHMLSYELSSSDSRVILLNFHVDVVDFDPVKCVLTSELIPVNLKNSSRISQAIWLQNITMQNLQFRISARHIGLGLINSNITIPPQSVWPLIVEYKPSDFENKINLIMSFKGTCYNVPLTCKGILEKEYASKNECPVTDFECDDFPYSIFPNKLDFITEINTEKSLLVAVHNHNQKCMRFKWQTYSIKGYFMLTFEPIQFTLKPQHSKLCVVYCKTFDKLLHFRRLPAVLEIHRILDKSAQIAQELLSEIESIDDPKWKEDTYIDHFFLHIDLQVNFCTTTSSLNKVDKNILPKETSTRKQDSTTIFEKLFGDFLSKSSYMRNSNNIPRDLTYGQVVQGYKPNNAKTNQCANNINNRMELLSFISNIVAESCRELSKNYRFIPKDTLVP